MKKRCLLLVVALVLVLCLLPGRASAAEVVASGEVDGITWTLTDDGTLTLSGRGYYLMDDQWDPWHEYSGSVQHLVVGEGIAKFRTSMVCSSVTSIQLPSTVRDLGDAPLKNYPGLKSVTIAEGNKYYSAEGNILFDAGKTTVLSVPGSYAGSYTIPEGVVWIGNYAFQDCTGLTAVTIRDGVTQLGNYAFAGCTGLSEVDIPGTVESIGDYAFSECSYLTGAVLNEGVSYIGEYAFENCIRLMNVSIPSTLTNISNYAFYECDDLTTLTLHEGLRSIGMSAFEYCSDLESFVLPGTIVSVGELAFNGCYAMKELSLEEGITSIGKAAFRGCGIEKIYIPASLTQIGVGAFISNPVTELQVSPDNPNYSANGLALLNKDQTWLYMLLDMEATTYTMPDTVLGFNEYVFAGNTRIREINLSASLRDIPSGAFSGCTMLREIVIPASVKTMGADVLFIYTGRAYKEITFLGDAPSLPLGPPFGSAGSSEPGSFQADTRIRGTVYYPIGNPTWTEEARERMGGIMTWIPNGNPFTDVSEDSFFYEPVIWAVQNGITNGMTETIFAPNGQCNRGQVVTFLWRAEGCPEPTVTEHPFVDVKEGAYYYKAMLWAVENGITNGTDATHFSPGKACDRATVVTFLWRAQGKPKPGISQHPFLDVEFDRYYYKAMLWALENGITSGTSDTTFSPTGICTRGQVVTFLYRTYAK